MGFWALRLHFCKFKWSSRNWVKLFTNKVNMPCFLTQKFWEFRTTFERRWLREPSYTRFLSHCPLRRLERQLPIKTYSDCAGEKAMPVRELLAKPIWKLSHLRAQYAIITNCFDLEERMPECYPLERYLNRTVGLTYTEHLSLSCLRGQRVKGRAINHAQGISRVPRTNWSEITRG
jgi:hypothetical protein